MKQPDIFIILTEDICPNFGCYGDTNARTPNIDAFAKENIKFNYCSSAAPVCSAARTSLNLGMYGSTAGVGQHRSYKPLPPQIKNIGSYMQEAGYQTAIGKTDFNFVNNGEGYDNTLMQTRDDTPAFAQELQDLAKNATKPLFVLQSILCTHQSQYGYTQDHAAHRATMQRLTPEEYANRDEMQVPGYHFDSPEAREIWGQYHEKITVLDHLFGETIAALKAIGKYENSLIFFAGDNGHGIPLGKCELWNEGVHVPFLMHVPEHMAHDFDLQTDEHGQYTNRLASFLDFAATSLSVAGAPIPPHLQGNVLVGEGRTPAPEGIYSFSERVDEVFENSRCMRTQDALYACDFAYSPTRRPNAYQTVSSPWFNASMKQKGFEHNIADTDRRAFFRGIPRVREQLFDMKNDPNQLENIAPQNAAQTLALRKSMLARLVALRDDALMPEPIAHQFFMESGLTPYEILQMDSYYPVAELANIWESVLDGNCTLTNHANPNARMMILQNFVQTGEMEAIKAFLADENETVAAFAAYCLGEVALLKNICATTKNYVLLMYIADLIATWQPEQATPCLDAIYQNCAVEHDFKPHDRYHAPMQSALQLLSHRFNHPLAPTPLFDTSSAKVAKTLDVTLAE